MPLTEPTYVRKLPMTDGWGHPFQYWSDGQNYVIVSPGKNGTREGDLASYRSSLEKPAAFPAHEKDRDIVFGNGSFAAWPEP